MTIGGVLDAAPTAALRVRDWIASTRFLSGLVLGLLVLLIGQRRFRQGTSLTLGLPFSLGSATITPSHADRIAAWRLYVQLKTRKAAITFDDEGDVVAL